MMENKSVNKVKFHFWGARNWAPIPLVYQYENCSGYVTGNMPFLTSNFLQKFECCKNQKSSLGETKNIFHNFLRALF